MRKDIPETMNKRFLALTTALVFGLSALSGCGKKEEEATTAATTTEEYSINLQDNSLIENASADVPYMKDGKIQSDLTGEWVLPEENNKRPMAITINNIYEALPQSGIENADIIYEMLEEGRSVTRFLCVFSDYKAIDKLGPVRSARHYFTRKAMEYDAVFVHWGHSIYAGHEFDVMQDLDQIDLNGKDGGAGFRVDRPGYALEHTGYTSGENIANVIGEYKWDTNKCSSYKKMFSFNYEDTPLADGKDCKRVTTAFTEGLEPYFEYDSESKTFLRYENGSPQIDENTGNQLKFKNVIVQYCPHQFITNDQVGCIDINLNGKGKGYYFTDGKYIPIKWKKKAKAQFIDFTSTDGMLDGNIRTQESGKFGVTKYYTKDGKELKLNPGKTFVAIFPDDRKKGIEIE